MCLEHEKDEMTECVAPPNYDMYTVRIPKYWVVIIYTFILAGNAKDVYSARTAGVGVCRCPRGVAVAVALCVLLLIASFPSVFLTCNKVQLGPKNCL
jgi:hypothetical protein